jgi:hypothetical protein
MHVVLLETNRIAFVNVCTLRWLIFKKKQKFTKFHSIMFIIIIIIWYHGFKCNKVQVSKAIESTLI